MNEVKYEEQEEYPSETMKREAGWCEAFGEER